MNRWTSPSLFVGLIGLSIACSAPNPRFDSSDGGGSLSSDPGSSSGSESAQGTSLGSGGATLTASEGATGSTTVPETADSTAGRDSDTSPVDCADPLPAQQAYPPCFDTRCPDGTCALRQAGPPVFFDVSVCEPSCAVSCQCPPVDGSDALPECVEGQCQLACDEEQHCPSSMACVEDRCLWASAYGPCDNTCVSDRCVVGPSEGQGSGAEVCAALDCWDNGALNVDLCPPPLSGDAMPLCFGPQDPPKFKGEGWCILSCDPGVTDCPEGMVCDSTFFCAFE